MNTKLDSVADDYISRCKWLRFQALVPQADPTPTKLHCTKRNLANLAAESNRLLKASMANNKWHIYKTVFERLNQSRFMYIMLPMTFTRDLQYFNLY